MDSLALAQGVFHTVASELLVVVDEGEGQVNVEGVGSVRSCCPFPRLKRYHQIHPGGRSLDLKLVDEILAKDLTQQLLKLIVDPKRTVGATWTRTEIRIHLRHNDTRDGKTPAESFYLRPCTAPSDVLLEDGSDGQSGPRSLHHSPPRRNGHLHQSREKKVSVSVAASSKSHQLS